VLKTAVDDGVARELGGLKVLPYEIPEKCVAGYYPECNVLIPLWHYAQREQGSRGEIGAGANSPPTSGRLIAAGEYETALVSSCRPN
jgi:hypothetical protein